MYAIRSYYVQREQIEQRRYGSAAIALAYVAAGRFDGYHEAFIHAWDIMAGVQSLEDRIVKRFLREASAQAGGTSRHLP